VASSALSNSTRAAPATYRLIVLTLAGSKITEITLFADSSVFTHFGLLRRLPKPRR